MTFIIIIIAMALLFDFLNGMNDAANSIATVVSTRVLPPKLAVLWAAFFNFIAVAFMGVTVAKTIGKGIVDPSVITSYLLFSALLGAIIWTYTCTIFGLPISVSHALIGGMIGPAIITGGFKALVMSGILKVCLFIVLSPLIGLFLGFLNMVVIAWIIHSWAPHKVDGVFRKLQLVSSAIYSISHGANDAQKTMGVIAVLLYVNGFMGTEFYIPLWVIIACYGAIAFGTLMGGWKVVETMGLRLTKLQPHSGFCAETGGGTIILILSAIGIPVSTTHTISGAIAGVGSARRMSAVRWNIAGKIIWAWIMTIPAAAVIGAGVYMLEELLRKIF